MSDVNIYPFPFTVAVAVHTTFLRTEKADETASCTAVAKSAHSISSVFIHKRNGKQHS